jgi:pimeloyl-ACP methyl ester carboxylesterase
MSSPLFTNATRRKLVLPGRGVEMALIDWGGDGPIALLHHANGFCAGMWALLAERLRPHYRVLALDARGHGDSTAPPPGSAYEWMNFVEDLILLAEQLADEQGAPIAYGIGNSFGGLVTAYAAGLRPGLFERVAMLDPVVRPGPDKIEEIRAKMPRSASRELFDPRGNPLAEAARRRQRVWPSRALALEKWQGKEMFENWEPRALRLYVDEAMRDRQDGQVELKCDPQIEASIFAAADILDLFEVAERIESPTLLLRAGRGYFPTVLYEEVVASLPNAKLVELDIDHLMPMHNPPELAEVLLDFGGAA